MKKQLNKKELKKTTGGVDTTGIVIERTMMTVRGLVDDAYARGCLAKEKDAILAATPYIVLSNQMEGALVSPKIANDMARDYINQKLAGK